MSRTAIGIYSGGGGIESGFAEAGFDVVFSTDNWGKACETLEANFPKTKVECSDIRELDFNQIIDELNVGEIDCVFGGPPCPAYSKSRFYRKEKKRALDDEHSFTLFEFFRVLEEVRPKVFFFENVHGFVYKPHLPALEYLSDRSRELGFNINYRVVNSADYGVPQIRQRFICIGTAHGLPKFEFPEFTHVNPTKNQGDFLNGKTRWVTAGQAIGDLDIDLPGDEDMAAGSKHKDLLKEVPPGDNYLYFTKERGYPDPIFRWRSRYWSFLLKLSPAKPSWTIQASHSNNMGPFHWKNRFLRISEIKRLQTFSDDYCFSGNYRSQWRQIGNAVPPMLSKIFAAKIMEQVFR